jgi:hypothetical protein
MEFGFGHGFAQPTTTPILAGEVGIPVGFGRDLPMCGSPQSTRPHFPDGRSLLAERAPACTGLAVVVGLTPVIAVNRIGGWPEFRPSGNLHRKL